MLFIIYICVYILRGYKSSLTPLALSLRQVLESNYFNYGPLKNIPTYHLDCLYQYSLLWTLLNNASLTVPSLLFFFKFLIIQQVKRRFNIALLCKCANIFHAYYHLFLLFFFFNSFCSSQGFIQRLLPISTSPPFISGFIFYFSSPGPRLTLLDSYFSAQHPGTPQGRQVLPP